MMKKKIACFLVIFILIIVATGVLLTVFGKKSSLDRIIESGEIAVLTRNNAHCYYTYRGESMGFEYDLAKAFSDFLGVKLKVNTSTWGNLISNLQEGQGDFIAASLTIIPSREERADFSKGYMKIQQQAIIHKYNYKLSSEKDLNGKTVHVRQGTSYEERLQQLNEEGLEINIKTHQDTPTEELIGMVADREIDITIADSNVALLNRRYYPDIKIAFPIEEPQGVGWAVSKGENELLEKINEFFKKIKEDGTFARINEKYYADLDIFDYVDLKKYHSRITTRLPKYEKTIKDASEKYGFDWRMIAAMVYQESHFDPDARSMTGVEGLMQLTKITAEELGVSDRTDPEQAIWGGVKYLNKLYKRYSEAGDPDRMLITLASYNVGRGHILDAQKIARERNLDPFSWAVLEEILPLLRNPKYYKKAKYGYCRGTEPVRYVERILTYYDILRRNAIS